MERRFTKNSRPITVETREDGTTLISGYAAVYYNENDAGSEYELWDGVKERINRGAFDRALAENDDVRALFNHDSNLLLGRTTAQTLKLTIDEIGLRYDIVPADTSVANDVIKHIQRGDLTGSSFAFVIDSEIWRKLEDGTEIREIESVRLFDVGPVTYPAYESTTTGIGSRSIDDAKNSYDSWKTEEKQAERNRNRIAIRNRNRARVIELES